MLCPARPITSNHSDTKYPARSILAAGGLAGLLNASAWPWAQTCRGSCMWTPRSMLTISSPSMALGILKTPTCALYPPLTNNIPHSSFLPFIENATIDISHQRSLKTSLFPPGEGTAISWASLWTRCFADISSDSPRNTPGKWDSRDTEQACVSLRAPSILPCLSHSVSIHPPIHHAQLVSAFHGQALYGWCLGFLSPKRVVTPGTCECVWLYLEIESLQR